MRTSRWARILTALAFTAGTGCTTLREVPRMDYAARVPEKPVRVTTRQGQEYEFEKASIQADTLVGFQRREVEGPIDEYVTVRLPLDDVTGIRARRLDWFRTGMIIGVGVVAVGAAGLAAHK